jgi:hypothetical protein
MMQLQRRYRCCDFFTFSVRPFVNTYVDQTCRVYVLEAINRIPRDNNKRSMASSLDQNVHVDLKIMLGVALSRFEERSGVTDKVAWRMDPQINCAAIKIAVAPSL